MSESLFEHLFDISPFPAVVSRLGDKGVLAINKRTSELFGIPHAEAVGLFTTDYYVNPADRRLLAEPLERDGKADNVHRDIPRAELALRPGDRIVFYTDGITERQAHDDAMYDPDQFAAALTRIGAVASADIVRNIVSEVDRFAGGHEPEDDQTLLVAGFD